MGCGSSTTRWGEELCEACRRRDHELAEHILSDLRSKHKSTDDLAAIANWAAPEKFSKRGLPPFDSGSRPVAEALFHGSADCLKVLVSFGADLETWKAVCMWPTMECSSAVLVGHPYDALLTGCATARPKIESKSFVETCNTLVKLGVSIEWADHSDSDYMTSAPAHVLRMTATGAMRLDGNVVRKKRSAALQEMFEILIRHDRFDLNKIYHLGTILHVAAMVGDETFIRSLCAAGARGGHCATLSGRKSKVHPDIDGFFAIHLAVRAPKRVAVWDRENVFGALTASEAASRMHIVSLLVTKAGSDVNRPDSRGKTALHYSVANFSSAAEEEKKHYACLVEALLSNGADVTKPDREGTVPSKADIDLAREYVSGFGSEDLVNGEAVPSLPGSVAGSVG